MATKTKAKAKTKRTTTADARPKREVAIPAPVSGPVPPGLNDRRSDSDPIVGHFVEVTEGDDKGFFGIFVEAYGTDAVVRSHKDPGVRMSVPLSALVPSERERR